MRKYQLLIVLSLLLGFVGCGSSSLFRNAAQEQAFRDQYGQREWYTAITLRPYNYQGGYLVDLTGTIAEEQFDTYHTATSIPFGSRIRLIDIANNAILARIEGYSEVFRVQVSTQQGTADDVAKEIGLLLSPEPPLPSVRAAMRDVVARHQIAQGMSWREVYMSWGQPDKAQVMPSSASTLEEWVYFDKRMHLFLENGYVTNWQQM
ncbi:hypothetical protein C2W62_04610 [Candidatus Entotheonella serta]|nr:hypothetical protein C2W62_04610 [Candidatus Entotheonella serta]